MLYDLLVGISLRRERGTLITQLLRSLSLCRSRSSLLGDRRRLLAHLVGQRNQSLRVVLELCLVGLEVSLW